jgi:integrase
MAVTAKGHTEHLPSGSFRVHVYAGTDPATGEARRLKETCPDEASASASASTAAAAAAALGRLLAQAQSHQVPVRDANLGLVLDKYLEVTDLAEPTLATHESYIRRVIRPVLGDTAGRTAVESFWW